MGTRFNFGGKIKLNVRKITVKLQKNIVHENEKKITAQFLALPGQEVCQLVL